jgi:hypothetical protein
MKKTSKALSMALLSIMLLFLVVQPGRADSLEYKVKVGDSVEYEVKKLEIPADSESFTVTTEDGENITLKVNDKFKVEITALNETGAYGKFSLDGKSSVEEMVDLVNKTNDDISYWEGLVGSVNISGTIIETSLDGDLFVEETTSSSSWPGFYSLNRTDINKMNYKTGWLEYTYTLVESISYMGGTNGTTEFEYEMVGGGSDSGAPGFEFIPLIFSLILFAVIIKRRY